MLDGEAETTTETTTAETPPEALPDPSADTAAEGTALGSGEAGPGDPENPDTNDAGKDAAPVVPETYELTAPEGFALDDEAIALATPVFKELGLDNDQANKLMPVAAEFAKRQYEAGAKSAAEEQANAATVLRAEWIKEAKADPEIGGANWDATMHTAAKALDTLGLAKGTPFRQLLDDSGLGNHPEMIRAMSRVGKAIGEDQNFVRADAAPAARKSDGEVFYPNFTNGS